ncbi:hypothetical protein [Streptomyces sp. NPDC059575]|uniref:hypothetical protein n=1 Tax=Streptomyces sp. NPDC059575 TaxID=3346872 RepID=UPI00367A7D7A
MSGPAPLPPETVLVLDRDDWLYVYASFPDVTIDLEAMDVADAEYTAYAPDGRVLALTTPADWEDAGTITLTRTEEFDTAGLERRVARYWQRHQPNRPPLDPPETARWMLDEENRPREGRLARPPKRG